MHLRVPRGVFVCGVRVAVVAAVLNVIVFAAAQGLPAGWTSTDIGDVAARGEAAGTGRTISVSAAGDDIWGRADAFRFVYQRVDGNVEISARVDSLQQEHHWSKAGVMIRESLSARSRHAFMLVSGARGLAFQRREATSDWSEHKSGGPGADPYFVRLTRSGDTFTASKSRDGRKWIVVGRAVIPMSETVYVGLAVTSHAAGRLASARFSDIVVGRAGGNDEDEDESGEPDESEGDGGGEEKPGDGDEEGSPGPPSRSAALRVLHWNIHHGVGTDGKYDIDRLVSWMAKFRPDVISLNEVEKYTGWGNEDQPARIASLLSAKTGDRWNYHFAQRSGRGGARGQGNLVLSRLRIDATDSLALPCNRSAALARVMVDGRVVHIASTHLDESSSSCRRSQVKQLLSWLDDAAEQRIAAGDFNAQAGSSEIAEMGRKYYDGWKAARADRTAKNYSGNCDGCTRRSRIDYVFHSRQARLRLRAAQIFDTRDSRGKMPSDHKPMLVTYEVR